MMESIVVSQSRLSPMAYTEYVLVQSLRKPTDPNTRPAYSADTYQSYPSLVGATERTYPSRMLPQDPLTRQEDLGS